MAYIEVNDIFDDLCEENKRLLNELSLANKCIEVLNQFKDFVDFVSETILRPNLDTDQLKVFNRIQRKAVKMLAQLKSNNTSHVSVAGGQTVSGGHVHWPDETSPLTPTGGDREECPPKTNMFNIYPCNEKYCSKVFRTKIAYEEHCNRFHESPEVVSNAVKTQTADKRMTNKPSTPRSALKPASLPLTRAKVVRLSGPNSGGVQTKRFAIAVSGEPSVAKKAVLLPCPFKYCKKVFDTETALDVHRLRHIKYRKAHQKRRQLLNSGSADKPSEDINNSIYTNLRSSFGGQSTPGRSKANVRSVPFVVPAKYGHCSTVGCAFPTCDMRFDTRDQMHEHLDKHHHLVRCVNCQMAFSSTQLMAKHVCTSYRPMPVTITLNGKDSPAAAKPKLSFLLQCPFKLCQKLFVSQTLLEEHRLEHVNAQQKRTLVESATVTTISDESENSSDGSRVDSPVAGTSQPAPPMSLTNVNGGVMSSSGSIVKVRQYSHSGQVNCSFTSCQRRFASLTEMHKHLDDVHNLVQCDICEMKFSTVEHMKKHKLSQVCLRLARPNYNNRFNCYKCHQQFHHMSEKVNHQIKCLADVPNHLLPLRVQPLQVKKEFQEQELSSDDGLNSDQMDVKYNLDPNSVDNLIEENVIEMDFNDNDIDYHNIKIEADSD